MIATRIIVVVMIIQIGVVTASQGQQFSLVPLFAEGNGLTAANGVTVADYDQDGDLDIFIVARDSYDPADFRTWNRLLRNDGFRFSDVTLVAGFTSQFRRATLGDHGIKLGASWGDYDNDGYPDLFLSNYGIDELWHNNQDGTFENVTFSSGVRGCSACYSTNALWFDNDLDGDLDLYVSDIAQANRLYRNDGDGEFREIGAGAGLADEGETWTSLAFDVNQDKYPDMYVINDNGENNFYINNGDWTFTESTDSFGLFDNGNGMGVDLTDFNQDGQFDIYLTNIYSNEPNPFFVATTEVGFIDQAGPLGVDSAGWAWGCRFFDFDHDRDEDLFVVTGHELSGDRDLNMFFRNDGAFFLDLSKELKLDNDLDARGLETFDFDNDGDLDMIVTNWNGEVLLYRNNEIGQEYDNNHWVSIDLEGTTTNRDALGTRVRIRIDGEDQWRIKSGANLLGQSDVPIHFGLGAADNIDELEVIWSDGGQEIFYDIGVNRSIKIKESFGIILSNQEDFTMNSNINHFPNPFNKFLQQEVESSFSQEVMYSLFDALGNLVARKVYHLKVGSNTIDLSSVIADLPEGIYYYQMNVTGDTYRGKIVKLNDQ